MAVRSLGPIRDLSSNKKKGQVRLGDKLWDVTLTPTDVPGLFRAHLSADETATRREWRDIGWKGRDGWLHEGNVYLLGNDSGSPADAAVLIRHYLLHQSKALDRMRAEIRAYENLEAMRGVAQRQPISRDVQITVWQRDGGRCVGCGARERLEFDHIIPVAKGGSNSARNLQLLCEKCNRSKGANLG